MNGVTPDLRARAADFLSAPDIEPTELYKSLGAPIDAYVATVVDLLGDHMKRVKNRAAKLVVAACEAEPRVVYPYWGALVGYLDGDENILRWNAMIGLGFLAGECSETEASELVARVRPCLEDESMITAGHTITCLGRVALAKSAMRSIVVDDLLGVERMARNAECREILCGKALMALDPLVDEFDDSKCVRVSEFAARQLKSGRGSTQKIARRLMKRVEARQRRLESSKA